MLKITQSAGYGTPHFKHFLFFFPLPQRAGDQSLSDVQQLCLLCVKMEDGGEKKELHLIAQKKKKKILVSKPMSHRGLRRYAKAWRDEERGL